MYKFDEWFWCFISLLILMLMVLILIDTNKLNVKIGIDCCQVLMFNRDLYFEGNHLIV